MWAARKLRAHKKRRDDILRVGDLKEFRKFIIEMSGNIPSADEVVEVTFHKLRLEVTSLPDDLRRDSANWLLMHGLRRLYDEPVPLPDEPLPT